ncbi:MAG: 50S ribosomal protein L6 [Kiritimatiellae bacterium]|nr:50S ribosomal protein L6 [Kiritimatiellia bacterium]
MSRIGNQPVTIPAGVTVSVNGQTVTVKGPLGQLQHQLPAGLTARVEGAQVLVARRDDSRAQRGLHGLTRTLIANMIAGVTAGYRKELTIEGTGFKAQVQGQTLLLSLGFASPKSFAIPATIKITEKQGTRVTVEGIDKQLVGDVAARIRGHFPVEPYKGKGIKYADEQVRRKQGKTVA